MQPQVGERSGGQTVQGVKAVKPGGICALFIQRGPVDITAQPAAGAAPPQDDHPGPAGPPLIFQPDGRSGGPQGGHIISLTIVEGQFDLPASPQVVTQLELPVPCPVRDRKIKAARS